eukprot:scaffold68251_cov23-Tisochrysis_lutea.AAC.2
MDMPEAQPSRKDRAAGPHAGAHLLNQHSRVSLVRRVGQFRVAPTVMSPSWDSHPPWVLVSSFCPRICMKEPRGSGCTRMTDVKAPSQR